MEPILTLRVDSLAFGGHGVGRVDGTVCFIPYAAPGDLLSVRVVEDRGSFLRGEILQILEPGAGRREPRCKHFGGCGGCTWQHVDYAVQLEAKRVILEETISRIGGLRAPVLPVIPSAQEYGYRTRTRLHTAGSRIGYYARSSRHVVEVSECPILAPPLEARLKELRNEKAARSSGGRSVDATVELELDADEKVRERDGAEATAAMRRSRRSRPEHDANDDYAFHQVNRFLNQELARFVAQTIAERAGDRPIDLIDLYCGNGNLSLPLAARALSVRGFDTSEESIRRAAQSARSAGLDHARYARMDAARGLGIVATERAAKESDSTGTPFLSIIADPPRSGMKGLATTILELSPDLLIYVSCNPPALARDSRFFAEGGMRLELLQPLDMFPQTFHLETVAVFGNPGR